MKTLLAILLLSLTLNSFAQVFRRIPVLKPVRVYIPVKASYRHLRISPLAKVQGRINIKQIVINSAYSNNRADVSLNNRDKVKIRNMVASLKRRDIRSAKRYWQQFIMGQANQTTPVDIDEVASQVLRESYLNVITDLRYYASRVKAINEQKSATRDYLDQLKKLKTDCMRSRTCSPGLKRDIAKNLQDQSRTLSDLNQDAQLANIDLQNALQRQQQVIQTMSNVSKMMHDTAMAVIRKIG